MTMTLMEEREFPLLNRKQMIIKMDFPNKPTPSAATIKKELASFLKAEESKIAVKFIKQQFGHNSAVITAYLYKDEQSLKAIEEIKKRKKKGEKESDQEAQAKK